MARPDEVPELIPARMVNEYTYCPRLMVLEWVERDFRDNVETLEGRYAHRRVDERAGPLPTSDGTARSVELSAPQLGAIAKIDLVEVSGGEVAPIELKRGRPPDIAERVWEPERIQLCVQGMILEENGFSCRRGFVSFAETRERVEVVFDDALRARTREVLAELRAVVASGAIPPPLVDSPKCPRCSLVSLCLPDELNLVSKRSTSLRKLVPASDDAAPLYVQAAGARVGVRGERIVIEERDGTTRDARLAQTSQVALFGPVQLSTQALRELASREIPVAWFTSGGWLYAIATGLPHKNIGLRIQQHAVASSEARSLALARRFVVAKIKNCRTLLRRNADPLAPQVLDELRRLADTAEQATEAASLLGLEGAAARLYFESFGAMLRPPERALARFDFTGRNRRPPRDAVNALLSFVYALLARDLTATCAVVGLDPYLGFYHRPRYGRPALALDLMEEFRPVVADSVVLSLINTGAIREGHFLARSVGVALTPSGRVKVLEAYERRVVELVTHPLFSYRVSYRRIFEMQARLLARTLTGELSAFPSFVIR